MYDKAASLGMRADRRSWRWSAMSAEPGPTCFRAEEQLLAIWHCLSAFGTIMPILPEPALAATLGNAGAVLN